MVIFEFLRKIILIYHNVVSQQNNTLLNFTEINKLVYIYLIPIMKNANFPRTEYCWTLSGLWFGII